MKSNIPNIDRPPRPPLPPASTRRWRIERFQQDAGGPLTAIWFDRVMKTCAPPDVNIARVMSDEELDALRHAYDLGERAFSEARLAELLADPVVTARRLDYARAVAPREWRTAVGLDEAEG
jgi:hypothetical protein